LAGSEPNAGCWGCACPVCNANASAMQCREV